MKRTIFLSLVALLLVLAAPSAFAQWDNNEDAGCGAQLSGEDCLNEPEEEKTWNAPNITSCTSSTGCMSCQYVPALLRSDCVELRQRDGSCECEGKQSGTTYSCTVKGTCKYKP